MMPGAQASRLLAQASKRDEGQAWGLRSRPHAPGPLVKICSLLQPADGRVAAAAGADLVGLIFAPARRQITPATAAQIIAALRDASDHPPRTVGVFVDEAPARINALADALDLDLVQLSGDEPPEVLAALDRPALKALRLAPGTTLEAARRLAERYLAAPVPPLALTVESRVPGAHGGTGTLADWDLAAHLAAEYPIILAGGLTPDNVAAAIAAVQPLGVDVSSGVETDRAKDPDKIRAFVRTAKQTAQEPKEQS